MRGFGKIVAPDSVEVTLNEGGTKQVIKTKNILIATGSDVVSLPGLKVSNNREEKERKKGVRKEDVKVSYVDNTD